MANTATNVSVGKPKTAGGIYRAPLGTALPTDAVTALSSTFVSVGYVAEGGVTNSNSMETDTYHAWGGDAVMIYQTGKDDTFAFGLIETLNTDVQKIVHGAANVSGTMETGITINANSADVEAGVWVIDMALRGNVWKRIVIPNGKITEIGDVVYEDEAAINYPVTVTALADANGNTHYEYMAQGE